LDRVSLQKVPGESKTPAGPPTIHSRFL
jgi:hypothetical protein